MPNTYEITEETLSGNTAVRVRMVGTIESKDYYYQPGTVTILPGVDQRNSTGEGEGLTIYENGELRHIIQDPETQVLVPANSGADDLTSQLGFFLSPPSGGGGGGVQSVTGWQVDNADVLNPIMVTPDHFRIRSTTGLINQQDEIFEIFLSLSFAPAVSGDYEFGGCFRHSLNSTTQSFIAAANIISTPFTGDILGFEQEPQDSGGAGIVLNILEGGSINGSTNTGTSERYVTSFKDYIPMVSDDSVNFTLQWTATDSDIEAAIYNAYIYAKQI